MAIIVGTPPAGLVNVGWVRRELHAVVPLTPSERAAVALVALGLSNAEAALSRGVALSTFANQLSAAYRKLGVSSRRELQAASTTTPGAPDSARLGGLSPRQQQVYGLVQRGYANKVIAETIGVDISTVSTLLTRARRKLCGAPAPDAEQQRERSDEAELD